MKLKLICERREETEMYLQKIDLHNEEENIDFCNEGRTERCVKDPSFRLSQNYNLHRSIKLPRIVTLDVYFQLQYR